MSNRCNQVKGLALMTTFRHPPLPSQAVIGIAFSLGFLLGPTIGAVFSILGRSEGETTFTMFQYPALFSLSMAALTILITLAFFKESLPLERRVRLVVVTHPN